jgi:hypothetical protein
MKRKRHSEEQIIAILKEHEAGMKTAGEECNGIETRLINPGYNYESDLKRWHRSHASCSRRPPQSNTARLVKRHRVS